MTTNKTNNPTLADRIAGANGFSCNENWVYGVYTSGSYKQFFPTEEEAIAHCVDPKNGDQYTAFDPGELLLSHRCGGVFLANDRRPFVDAIAHQSQMPFVQWDA